MAKLVGQHQQTSFTSPSNGDRPIDATVVKGNDNTLATTHNAHDNNATVHVQSGTTAEKPAAGTVGRLFYDTTLGRMEYDNGSAWVTDNFASGPLASRPAASAVAAGTVYFDTTNNLFTYSDGATWSSLSPATGVTGSGTTSYLTQWTSGTTLGSSGIYYATVLNRTFKFDGTGDAGYAQELLGYTSSSPISTHNFIRFRGFAAVTSTTPTQAAGAEIVQAGINYQGSGVNNVNNNGLQCYNNSTNVYAYHYIGFSSTGVNARKLYRTNGFWIRAVLKASSGVSANQPEFLFVGFNSSVGAGYILGDDNVATLPNANGDHAAGIQLDSVGGQWRLVLHDGTNAAYDSYQISTSNATAIADDDEIEIWFGVDANTTTYRWKIVRNGTTVSEASYDASSMRNPGATNVLLGGVAINRTSAVTTEYVRIMDLLVASDV